MSGTDLQEWMQLASHDTDTADLLIREKGHADIIIYHIHQAIEKLLKALILKSGGKFDKTHFLDKLLTIVLESYPALTEVKDDILSINLYLPKLRYPYGEVIEFDEAVDVYNRFKKINKSLLGLISK